MKKLEDILKAAKPAVPDLPQDFSERVMSEVRKINLATAPLIAAKQRINWKQLTAGILLLLLSLVIVNNIVFEVQMNGSVELLYFGTQFLKDIFAYFPFDLVIPAIIVTGLSSWLMWNSKVLKRGIAAIIIGSYLTTTFGGAALAATGINEQIQAAIIEEKRDWPLLSWYFKERARYFIDIPNFKMGRVEKLEGRFIWIMDPHGNKTKLELPVGMQVRKGQIISMTGVKSGDHFRVSTGRHCNQGSAGRYFHHMSTMNRGMDEKMRKHHRRMQGDTMMMKRKSCCVI